MPALIPDSCGQLESIPANIGADIAQANHLQVVAAADTWLTRNGG